MFENTLKQRLYADTAEACIVAAESTGMAPIVRPVGNKPEIIAPF